MLYVEFMFLNIILPETRWLSKTSLGGWYRWSLIP